MAGTIQARQQSQEYFLRWDKQIHEKYKSGEFKIVYDDDKKELTQADLTTFGYGVQVFNSEFIKQN
ncbi:MAG: hypothetical protein IPN31_11545 [Bacteroidetes bacterium]|nr:hypothetical protein [Bacteroidota bacterium]